MSLFVVVAVDHCRLSPAVVDGLLVAAGVAAG